MHQCIAHILRHSLVVQFKNGSWKLLRSDGIGYNLCNQFRLFWNQKSFKSSTSNEIIGETDLLFEDDMNIQELPVIIRKIAGTDVPVPVKPHKPKSRSFKKLRASEKSQEREIIEGFDKCCSQTNVFALLELIPPSEITPAVALQALKTIVKFDNRQTFKCKFDIYADDEDFEEILTKSAIISSLIDIIIASNDNNVLLKSFQLVSVEMSGENAFLFRQKLCDEVLIRIADDKFTISEICSTARSLLVCGNQVDIDKLWIGIIDRQRDINEDNIMELFRMLLHVNRSRSLLLKILQKQIDYVVLKLKGENIAEILTILNEIKEFPYYIIMCLSNWLNIKCLKISEDDLCAIIERFMILPRLEEDVVKAMERFMQVKLSNIKNPELVATIMDYCNKFKVRSLTIFECCSKYLVQNAKTMSPLVLKSIVLPFGNLNFHPVSDIQFWKVLEEELMDKFTQFYSEDALDIMLCLIFLERYPIKFVTKIFNPYFLDRLHSLKDAQQIQIIRTKLKLLDTALTLECKLYQGPLLPPDLSSTLIKQDLRIQKMADSLLKVLPSLLGPDKSTSSSVVLKNLPLTELYIVDIIVHPKGKPSLLYPTDSWNDFTALLIHLPEHYDSSGQFLIGSQVMRKRHLRCIGLNVVDLNYYAINSLLSHESELKEYLKTQLANAEQAFPS